MPVRLREYGIPDELLTDNGKQFTARFNAGGGEVMFERICRENGIVARNTEPRTPTTNGRWSGFIRRCKAETHARKPPN